MGSYFTKKWWKRSCSWQGTNFICSGVQGLRGQHLEVQLFTMPRLQRHPNLGILQASWRRPWAVDFMGAVFNKNTVQLLLSNQPVCRRSRVGAFAAHQNSVSFVAGMEWTNLTARLMFDILLYHVFICFRTWGPGSLSSSTACKDMVGNGENWNQKGS